MLFETEMWLPHPREDVFAFFTKAENLQEITPPWLHFKILTPLPITLKEGAVIDYQLRLFGICFSWGTEITEWQPPHHFVDVQTRGPYRLWRHKHGFEDKNGGTLMRDEVQYVPRGGILAPLIDGLFVRRNVNQIFRYRKERIGQLLSTTGFHTKNG